MSLRVWLPLTKDLRNQGLDDVTVTNNGVTFNSAGKLGGCYSFNGSSYITVQDVVLQNIWSYSCWLYSDISSRSWEVVMACNINGGDADMQLGLYTRPAGNVIQNTANGQYNASIPMTYGQWNHFVGTFDGANLKTYLNGVLVNTKAITNAKLDRPKLTIGARCRGSSYDCYFKGLLNDVRIYDHCLSPMEVKELSKGLVLHYPLNRQGWGQENLLSRYVVPGQAAPTSTAAGGRTTWLGDYKITIPATKNADTYFRLFTTKKLTTNATYTISCNVEGLLSGSYYRFPLYAQGNTAMGVLNLDHNGLCSLTFTMTYGTQTAATGANGETVYICFMDDSSRAIASGQGAITISNFKLEEGSIVTPWCPNSSDILATTMGLNGTTEYDCSGFCNNGTRTGTFTWTSDTPKYSVSTYMPSAATISHPRCLDNTSQEWTCAAWVKPDAAGNYQNLNNFNESNRLYHGTYPLLYLNSGTNDYYNYGNLALPANQWSHIVFVFKNSTGTKLIYVNGENRTNTGGPNKTSTPKGIPDTVIIGGSYAGYISDYREYATALSASDVKSLYQNCATIDPDGTIRGKIRS